MFYLKEIFTEKLTIPLTAKVNIITGYTGQNKTLLYTAVGYLFCASSNLGTALAIKNLSSAFIGAVVTDGCTEYRLKRTIGASFYAEINDKKYEKMEDYKKALNTLFSFTPIKVQNGVKNITFNVSDFMDLVFIPESQLTSQNNIFEKGGYSEKGKFVNYFKYMLTGISVDEKVSKKNNDLARNYKRVSDYRKAVDYVLKPKKDETKKRESLIESKSIKQTEMDDLNSKIEIVRKQIEEKKIVIYRLNVLKKSYESDLSDCVEAGYFEDIERMCESDQISQIDYSYYSDLKNSLDEINFLLVTNTEVIERNEGLLLKNEERIKEIEKEIFDIEKELESSDNIRVYDDCIGTIETLSNEYDKQKKEIDSEFDKQKNNIDSTFNNSVSLLSKNVKSRLNKWGCIVHDVDYNHLNSDFLFDGVAIKHVPKGEKSIFTFALNVEILLLSKEKIKHVPNFLLVDSLWVSTNLKNIESEEIKERIILDIYSLNIQTIIFENENQRKKVPECNYFDLDN